MICFLQLSSLLQIVSLLLLILVLGPIYFPVWLWAGPQGGPGRKDLLTPEPAINIRTISMLVGSTMRMRHTNFNVHRYFPWKCTIKEVERCFLKYKELLAHLNVLAGKPGYREQQGEEGGGGKKHGQAERLAVKVSCDGYLNVYPAHFLNLPLKFSLPMRGLSRPEPLPLATPASTCRITKWSDPNPTGCRDSPNWIPLTT